MASAVKWNAKSGRPSHVTRKTVMESWFVLLHSTVPYKPWYQTCSDHALSTWQLSKTGGDPGERCMYDTMKRELYWSQMTSEVYTTVGDCRICLINRAGLKKERHLKRFPASEPLEFVAMDILSPLPKKTNGNGSPFIVLITDRYKK